MKILVPVKRVLDPDKADLVRIGSDNTSIDQGDLAWKVNPFDEYAVETALRLLENTATGKMRGELLVVGIGPEEATQQIRWCLSMGAQRGILVQARDEGLDATVVAMILAKMVEEEAADLVIMGKQTVDGESNQTAQILAEILGWPQATFAGRIVASPDLARATVTREVDGGNINVTIAFPAVISVDVRIVTPGGVQNNVSPPDKPYDEGPRYATLGGIMKAKKIAVETMTLEELGIEPSPLVHTLSFSLPPQRKAGVILKTVEELVLKLKDEAKVL